MSKPTEKQIFYLRKYDIDVPETFEEAWDLLNKKFSEIRSKMRGGGEDRHNENFHDIYDSSCFPGSWPELD